MRLALRRTGGTEAGLWPVLLRRRLRYRMRLALWRTEGPEAGLRTIALLRRTWHCAICGRHFLAIARRFVGRRISTPWCAVLGCRLLLIHRRPRHRAEAVLGLRRLLPGLLRIRHRRAIARPAAKLFLLRHPARLIYLLVGDSGAQRLFGVAIQWAARIVLQRLLLGGKGNGSWRSRHLSHHLPRLLARRRRRPADFSPYSQNAVA